MTQTRSRKPIMNPIPNIDEDEDDDDSEAHWYHSHSSLGVNNNFTHQSSSATKGSWGFDVNRSTNVQTPSNNNNNNDQQTIIRTTKGYNEQFVDRSSSSPQIFKLRTPTLTRQKNGNEFSAVDRLVRGPKQTDSHRSDESFQQPMNPITQHKTQTEQELLAWQNRMLEREQRYDTQSPKLTHKRIGNNSSRSSTRQIPTSIQPISHLSDTQHDHDESTIKSARVIKRYIELLYHLQSFYERITDQLSHGNNLSITNQIIFTKHCRQIADQVQKFKPIWEEKLSELQNLLKDIASSQLAIIETETTFLQRRSTLNNLFQTLSIQKDLNPTNLSIRSDIDRVLYDDKLAVQLQNELSTLLQHQSLLNDSTSLLQWNRPIYSSHEQNRVDTILPLLREQMTTTESYISHVSEQLTELVMKIRSAEKYILSYTNAIPLIDDAIVPSQSSSSSDRSRWRPYEETDIDSMRTRESRQLRSISMSRFEELDSLHSMKTTNHHLNMNNSNNNLSSTRLATIKSAKRDHRPPLNSILKPTKVDIPDRSVDFDTDERMLTTDERLIRMKKKDDVRKMISKQHSDQDFSDGDQPRRYHLQSRLAEEAKEKSRQVAAKHYINKSHQQRSIYPNS